MRVAKVLIAAAVLLAGATGMSLGTAAPATAMPTITGVYDFHSPNSPAETWVIYSTCVPMGCTLHVSTTVPRTAIEKAGDFRLTNGLWSSTMPWPTGTKCSDGTSDYSMETYTFDSQTLQGTHTTSHAAVCGLEPALTKKPFTLTYVAPTPIPNNEHPLFCDNPWWCPF